MTPSIYLCGPIANCTHSEAHDWRNELKNLFVNQGVTFIDPTDWKGKNVVQRDLHAIAQCDAIVANCWKPSYGSAMEVVLAFKAGKYVSLVSPRPLSPWLQAHCHVHSPNHILATQRIIGWFFKFKDDD
jgi:nucleoside 2-deoxyribosyltransferase